MVNLRRPFVTKASVLHLVALLCVGRRQATPAS